VHLFSFIIRIYCNARLPERQINNTLHANISTVHSTYHHTHTHTHTRSIRKVLQFIDTISTPNIFTVKCYIYFVFKIFTEMRSVTPKTEI